jgi:DNA (cytosine-5)-methyltransferase 1
MRTVAFCEIDPYCRRVLAKRWPAVPCYGDIRKLTGAALAANGISVDVICGGFPCQDISTAGLGAGIEGSRSGLWSEYARIIGEVRPRYVLVENVAALLGRGIDTVLRDLAALGFDAEWHCIPASAVGAPHRRDRVWIVADASRVQPGRQEQWAERQRAGTGGQSINGADAETSERRRSDSEDYGWRWDQEVRRLGLCGDWSEHWFVEPDVGRVAHGIPSRVDRLKGLGNAVVPQIPEIIGRAIMTALSVSRETQP